jgi:hypothetical protein
MDDLAGRWNRPSASTISGELAPSSPRLLGIGGGSEFVQPVLGVARADTFPAVATGFGLLEISNRQAPIGMCQ